MSFFEDMIYVNKSAFEKTFKSFVKNWFIVFTGIVYTFINLILYRLLGALFTGPLFILSGIASALITSTIVSNYLYLLFNIVNYNRLTINNFKDGFTELVRKIYGVLFVAYIASLLFSFIIPNMGMRYGNFTYIIYLIAALVLNALPETIYLKSYGAWDSIVYAFEFFKENLVNWLVPNVIFYGMIYIITGKVLLEDIFNTHIGFNFSKSITAIIIYTAAQVLFSFMMIYRGHLYKILSTSTRRKRTFMRKI